MPSISTGTTLRRSSCIRPHATSPGLSRFELIRKLVPSSKPRHTVDIIVGGPPCQAFARVGRAKLREIMEHPEAFLEDARAHLYTHYLQFVEALAPVAILVENVPDVLNYGGVNIFELMSSALGHLGYECRYGLLNSAHYGVPQMRERAFLLAVAQTVGVVPTLPTPTHRWSCHADTTARATSRCAGCDRSASSRRPTTSPIRQRTDG